MRSRGDARRLGRVLFHGELETSPRRLTWIDTDGKPLAKDPYRFCSGHDLTWDTLVDGETMWVHCKGALALLDPAHQVARMAEAFPEDWQTRGLLPGPNGSLALVLFEGLGKEPEDPSNGLRVAIAGTRGWLREPSSLPVSGPRHGSGIAGDGWGVGSFPAGERDEEEAAEDRSNRIG